MSMKSGPRSIGGGYARSVVMVWKGRFILPVERVQLPTSRNLRLRNEENVMNRKRVRMAGLLGAVATVGLSAVLATSALGWWNDLPGSHGDHRGFHKGGCDGDVNG